MKCTRVEQKKVDIKFPCLMEFIDTRDKRSLNLVVLMVEKGRGVVVDDPDNQFGVGHGSDNWLEETEPNSSSGYWTPWDGSIILEND